MGSNGNGTWYKSSFCASGNGGVEIWFGGGAAHVRNGADRHGPVLVFSRDEWDAFLLGAFNGEFEMPL
ncbi:MAG: DUF397 domain-containing protein [Catenulispora sp.]